AEAFAKATARLQTILGEHQDSVTAQSWLRAARVSGRRAVVAGGVAAGGGRADRAGGAGRDPGAREVAQGVGRARPQAPAGMDALRTFYVVRHARAGDRGAWTGDDRARPLTKKGVEQAEQVVLALGAATLT